MSTTIHWSIKQSTATSGYDESRYSKSCEDIYFGLGKIYSGDGKKDPADSELRKKAFFQECS